MPWFFFLVVPVVGFVGYAAGYFNGTRDAYDRTAACIRDHIHLRHD